MSAASSGSATPSSRSARTAYGWLPPKPQVPQVHLLRAADGAEVATLKWALSDSATPNGLAFWPDSSAVLVANAHVEIWLLNGPRTHRMKLGAMTMPHQVACSPDGAFIVASAGTLTKNKLFVWSGRDCAPVAKLVMPGSIADLAWSPHSAWLALAIGNEARLVQVPSGDVLTCYALDALVTDVAVAPDGTYLAATSRDHSARVFDLRTGAEVARISRPVEVTAVAFAPSGQLAVGDASGTVQLWAPPS
jgi:WD40 repeat protein